jgi:hypothetical protein
MADDQHKAMVEFVDKDFIEVGKVILNWNSIELQMQVMVLIMLQINWETADIIMSMPSVPMQTDILIAVAKDRIKPGPLLDEIKECAKRVKGLSNFRHEIAHGRWTEMTTADGVIKTTLVKKGSAGNGVTAEQVHAKSAEMRILFYRLSDCRAKIVAYMNDIIPGGVIDPEA